MNGVFVNLNGAKWRGMAGDTVKNGIDARIERLERMTDGGYMPVVLRDAGDGRYIRVDAARRGEVWTRADIDSCTWTVIIIDV